MTLKIDARAVHAELQAISRAMSEVTRQMGPQTWQGGSAAAFTTDLQGHNRSLNRLMVDVERTVVRFNQVPMALDPPEIPRVTPPAGRPGVASVSPSALERLETALTRAAGDLPHRAKMIRGHLALAYPDIPSTTACDNAAAWCRTQAARMRTRIMYALAETEVAATPLIQGPVIEIPDLERFGSKEMTDLARLQARAWQKHTLHPGASTPALMSEIARTLSENSKNTTYLATFFSNIPPGSAGKLPYRLHQLGGTSGLTPEDKKTVGDLGTALAALSRTNEGIAAKALGPAGTDMPGQALLVKLSAPNVKWSSTILADLGKAALLWRQKYPSYLITQKHQVDRVRIDGIANQPDHPWWQDWGLEQDDKVLKEHDPALNVLGRISRQKDLTAARNLAAAELVGEFIIDDPDKAAPLTWLTRGNGGTYASLLVAPDWPDGGAAAGSVIRLATTPVKKHEEEAADNAAETMKTVAWWNEKGREKIDALLKKDTLPDWWPWGDIIPRTDQAPPGTGHSKQYTLELGAGLASGLLAMTRMHIPALADANRTSGGTGMPNRDPATGGIYVDIGGADLQQFLRTFAVDDRAWTQIAMDTEAYRQLIFAWGLRTDKWPLATKRAGQLEGNLIAAYGLERLKREELTRQEFEEAKKHIAILRDIGGSMLGATTAGAMPGVTDEYAIGTDLALDKIKYKDYEKKVGEIKGKYSTYTDQLYLDLARAVQLWKGTRTGDKNLDAALLLWPLAGRDSKQVIKAIKNSWLTPAEVKPRLSGEDLVGDAEQAVGHNAPGE